MSAPDAGISDKSESFSLRAVYIISVGGIDFVRASPCSSEVWLLQAFIDTIRHNNYAEARYTIVNIAYSHVRQAKESGKF